MGDWEQKGMPADFQKPSKRYLALEPWWKKMHHACCQKQ